MNNFLQMLNELNQTNSTNEKKEILTKYKNNIEINKILYYTLNPFYKYGVTIENINKYWDIKGIWSNYTDLFTLLDDLRNRNITWHSAIESILLFLKNSDITNEEKEILEIIINKDLNVNVWVSIINKIFLDNNWKWIIPQFKVSLATKIEDVLKRWEEYLDFENNYYVGSRKLDWVRTIAIFNNDWTDIKFYSREWNEFLTLDIIKQQFLNLVNTNKDLINYVFDGEMCIIDENWLEDFKKIVWDIKKKDFIIENPKYLLFDMIKKDDFLNKLSKENFNDRYTRLLWLEIENRVNNIEVLEHIPLTLKAFNKMLDLARSNKWEGLILRNWNAIYEWKRTKKMIKVKDFKDAEFEVLNTINWTMPILVDWNMIEKEVMASVEINYKWNIVNVWSGFSHDERLEFYNNPQKIIWKNITVKFFEETQDKDWNFSLRFPTFHWIRDYE